MSKTYWELLKDPRWQQMRLRVLERDGFRCQECFARDKTLHVHHTYYTKGAKPWEYEMDALITLCEECHKDAERELEVLRRLVGALDSGARGATIGYVRTLLALDSFGGVPLVVNNVQVVGVADAARMAFDDVLKLRGDDGTIQVEDIIRAYWGRTTETQVTQALDALDAPPPEKA